MRQKPKKCKPGAGTGQDRRSIASEARRGRFGAERRVEAIAPPLDAARRTSHSAAFFLRWGRMYSIFEATFLSWVILAGTPLWPFSWAFFTRVSSFSRS